MRRLYIASGLNECRRLRNVMQIPQEPTPIYICGYNDLHGWYRSEVCVFFVGNYNKNP